jgi:nitroreductase
MLTLKAIRERRAAKHYDPGQEMSPDEIEQLLAYAKLAPTAFNQQNYRFLLVRDPGLRQQLRQAAYDQAQVTNASLLIVICADLRAWEKEPRRYWSNAPVDVLDLMEMKIDDSYRNKSQVQRDEAMRSAGIAAQTIMLAAKSMGYDACPMDGFDFDAVAKLINLPEDHAVAMFVAVGKALQPARPRPTQLPVGDIVIQNRF